MDLKHTEKRIPHKSTFISMWKLRFHPPLLPHTFISKADEIELIKTTLQMGLSQGKCFEGRSSQNPRPPPTNPKNEWIRAGLDTPSFILFRNFQGCQQADEKILFGNVHIFYPLARSRYFLELFENCNKLDRLSSPLFWVLKPKWWYFGC